jgi:hypothetical protein
MRVECARQKYTVMSQTWNWGLLDVGTEEQTHAYILLLQWNVGFRGVRRVFKKRPNLLNSAPISTESMLQLMSAPSVRFWQQTATCPVLLWALVVELPPLNWARAQAVVGLQILHWRDASEIFEKNLMARSYADAHFISNFSDS